MDIVRHINILLFDEIELLDFTGPLEVFSVANYLDQQLNLSISTVGLSKKVTVSKSGLIIQPAEKINNQESDLLIIPGGFGTRQIIKNLEDLELIGQLINKSSRIASVCSGALILAKLEILRDQRAITHHGAIEELQAIDNSILIDRNERFVDNGNVFTSAGVSAGIDMSLYLVGQFYGITLKEKVMEYMEYKNSF